MARRAPTKQIDVVLAVETNFVVGVVWEERAVLKRIVGLCRQFGICVVVPEVALVEARASLLKRIDRQLDSLQQLRFWLNDIARGMGMSGLVKDVKQGLNAIETKLQQHKRGVLEALDNFVEACLIAPLTPEVWTKAYLRWQANLPPFKELDCLILESLLNFLTQHKARLAIFFTLDAEDFDHPEIHEAFRQRKALMLLDPYDVIVEFRKFYGVT
jgi:hypothetical protein